MKSLLKIVTRFVKNLLKAIVRYPLNIARRYLVKKVWRVIVSVVMAFVIGGGIINVSLPLNQRLVADVKQAESEEHGFLGNVFFELSSKVMRFFDYRYTLEWLKNGWDSSWVTVTKAGQNLQGADVSLPPSPSIPPVSSGLETGQSTALNQSVLDTFLNTPKNREQFNFNYYAVVGRSGIDTSVFPSPGEIVYSPLDGYDRTQVVRGALIFENVEGSYDKREKFTSASTPSGWGIQDKASIYWRDPETGEERTYNGYFYNRSHLIADSLGGNAERTNLITGTRTQNVGGNHKGGMRYSEEKAKAYLEANRSAVLYYEAEPIYAGTEAVPRGVVVRMLSSDGNIDESALVFNNAYGYYIDYQTGFFKKQE